MRRLIFLLVLAALPGCDAATAAIILSAQDKKSSDDGPSLPSTPPPEFKAYVAQVTDPVQERLDLMSAAGRPDTAFWIELGVFTATKTFDPNNAVLPPFNAILITASSTQDFLLDCVEILDSDNTVVEYASGTTYSNLVDLPDEILGSPDGVGAMTNAVDPDLAFLFTLYTGPIDKFRINGRGPQTPPAPGDTVAVGSYTSAGDERPGGMAIDPAGLIHLTMSVGDTGWLVRYDVTTGAFVDEVEISPDLVTVGNGSHSVALDSGGVIFTACSVGSGLVQVRRFETDLTGSNVAGFSSGNNNDRVEHNSIAVDSAGDVVVVGGMSSIISGRNHWRVKIPPAIDLNTDPPVWQNSSQLDGATILTTYWHAVTTGTNNLIFTAGDLNSGLLGTTQVYTAKFNAAGAAQWDESYIEGDQPADVGHAIELSPSGNVFVGGSVGTDTDAKDGVLLAYTADGAELDDTGIVGAAGGNDEILDIAVDQADSSVYAVGYETVTGQGENWVVRKFSFGANGFPVFAPVWARTHHGGFGNDRAVSVAISGNNLVVAGYETNSTGQTKLVLRVYEK